MTQEILLTGLGVLKTTVKLTGRPDLKKHEKNSGQVVRYTDLTNMGALPRPFELDNLVKFL